MISKGHIMTKCSIISCSGADDNTEIDLLLDLASSFPCVEVAIQLSKKLAGIPGFPTLKWIYKYVESVKERMDSNKIIKSSLHINSDYCDDVLNGKVSSEIELLLKSKSLKCMVFSRYQFNFYDLNEIYSATAKCYADYQKIKLFVMKWPQRMILQYNNLNLSLYDLLHSDSVNFDILFDSSFGAGHIPQFWPKAIPGYFCAYSGGLGPYNLNEHILRIQEKTNNQLYGLDAHSGLRNDENQFSIRRITGVTSCNMTN